MKSSFPKPNHNFPSPIQSEDRDYDEFPYIDEFNRAVDRLSGIQYGLYDTNGVLEFKYVEYLKEFLQGNFLPSVMNQLNTLPVVSGLHDGYEETLCPVTRDRFVNVGAGFFLSGLYLIMMGSNTSDGVEAIAANFHLEKGIGARSYSVCPSCGHKNCNEPRTCVKPTMTVTPPTNSKNCETAWL